jgi:uncharacterized damage-inducible protein DinB
MQLSIAASTILNQLATLINQLSDSQFVSPSKSLSNSTIGQHLRHTLEFFICLEQGYAKGVVNYDKRNHDKLIETDRFIALGAIQKIRDFISTNTADQKLTLEVGYEPSNEDSIVIETNYFRELTYNIEHAVHHMAIMKIGVREVASAITLPANFGVAISTIKYQQQQPFVTVG